MAARVSIVVDADWKGKGSIREAADDMKKLGQDAGKAEGGLNKAASGSDMLKGKLAGLVTGGTILAVAAGLGRLGKQALDAASDVEEMQAKFDTVFSNVGDKVAGDLDKFAEAAGRSRFELQGMAATLGDTLKPLGMTEQAAGQFSVQLVQLATDLSSFNNMPMDEALRRLQGTLIGSHENALAFGVVINENTLKAELAAQGWDKLTGAALEQAKVQARINLLMRGTTDAQGDAIRTADSYANQQRALAAATEELSVALGQQLLPSAKEGTGIFAGLVGAAADFTKAENELIKAQEAGLITMEESKRLQLEMLSVRMSSADVLAELDKAYQQNAANLEYVQQSTESWDRALTRTTATVEAHVDTMGNFRSQYEMNAAVQRDLINETDTYAVTAEQVAEADRRRAEAADEAAAAQQRLIDAERDYFTAALESKDATFNQNEAIFESAQAAGASAESLAILGGALGLYSEDAVEAALRTAAIQIKIDELAQSYANGQITVDEMRARLQDYIATLDSVPESVATQVSADTSDAESKIQNIKNLLAGIGAGGVGVGATVGGAGRAMGGYITGGTPGRDSVPAMLMPGEYVIRKSSVDKFGAGFFAALNAGASPTGFAGGGMAGGRGGGGVNVTINVNAAGGDGMAIAGAAREGTLAAMRQWGLAPV